MSQSRSRSTGRRVRLLAVLLVGGLVAAACGNSGDKEGGDTTAAPTSAATETTGSTGSTSPGSDTTGVETTVDYSQNVPITGVPGVSDTEIAYSVLATGPASPTGACVLECLTQGVEAYFQYVNDNGGVWGRQLKVTKKVDDELVNQQVKALEIVNAKDTFATFVGGFLYNGIGELDKAGWASFHFPEAGPGIVGLKSAYIAVAGVGCIDCPRRTGAYAAKSIGATKIAALGYGISDASKQCVKGIQNTFEKYGADVGAEVVYVNDALAYGLPNGVGPEVTAMKAAGVDFVMTCIDLNGDKTIKQEMQRQGLDAKMYHPNLYDPDFVKESPGLFDGDISGVSFRPFELPDNDAMTLFKEYAAKTGIPVAERQMDGWLMAMLAVEGLKAAGPEFDQQKVIDAMNSFTAWDADGLIAPIDWSRQHNPPTLEDPVSNGPAQECFTFVTFEGETIKPLGDPAKPWSCWPGDDYSWSEPVPTDFG